jgi:hypothetical protein
MKEKLGLLGYVYKFFGYLVTSKLPEIKSVDLFFNQFETQNNGESDGRANPRALIEILDANMLQGFGGNQEVVLEVKLHIGIDIINSFSSGSELESRNLIYLNLLDRVYKQLAYTSSYNLPEELKNDDFAIYQVERSSIVLATNPEGAKVTTITFRCIVEDRSARNYSVEGEVNTVELTIDYKGDEATKETVYIRENPN